MWLNGIGVSILRVIKVKFVFFIKDCSMNEKCMFMLMRFVDLIKNK